MKRVYLAGPMSGIPEFNYPAFAKATAELRAKGYEVFSPAENDGDRLSADKGIDIETGKVVDPARFRTFLREVFAEDMEYICKKADAIAMLPGWENSGGARAEWAAAHMLRLEFIYL